MKIIYKMRTLFAISFLIDISLALTSDQYLTHYWPICNNQMSDHIGSAHMTLGSGVSYTMDRFGTQYEALSLSLVGSILLHTNLR